MSEESKYFRCHSPICNSLVLNEGDFCCEFCSGFYYRSRDRENFKKLKSIHSALCTMEQKERQPAKPIPTNNADTYDLKPIGTNVGKIFDKHSNILKPFAAAYIPKEILERMGWTEKTHLKISIENGFLKVFESNAEPDADYFKIANELTYEAIQDEA